MSCLGLVAAMLVLRFYLSAIDYADMKVLLSRKYFFSHHRLCCNLASTVLSCDATSKANTVFQVIDYSAVYFIDCGNLYTLCWVCWKVLWGWSCLQAVWTLAMVGVGLKRIWEGLSSCCIHSSMLFWAGLILELRLSRLCPLWKPWSYSYGACGVLYTLGGFFVMIHVCAMAILVWHLFVCGWDSESNYFFQFFITRALL